MYEFGNTIVSNLMLDNLYINKFFMNKLRLMHYRNFYLNRGSHINFGYNFDFTF
jgi:hypothetical protein